jgi:phosphate transport system permease protein
MSRVLTRGLSKDALYGARRAKNIVAQILATIATIFGLFLLAWIVWTTLRNGLASLDLDLFTR